MNKSLVKKGNTLSKNMTQTESLTLMNASIQNCTSANLNTTALSCLQLDLPILAAPSVTVGQCYFNPATHKLYIADGTKKADNVTYNWYSIQLTLEPFKIQGQSKIQGRSRALEE